MLAEDYKKNLNFKDIINKQKNRKLTCNWKHSEEVENNSYPHNFKTHPNNTPPNLKKTPKSLNNIWKDKKSQKFKDQKLLRVISKNKEMNQLNKEIIMMLFKEITVCLTRLSYSYRTEAGQHMTLKKEE